MTDKATERPWKYWPWHIAEGVATVTAGSSPASDIICTTASDADAALIVRAVNSYDEGRAIMKDCAAWLNHLSAAGDDLDKLGSEELIARIRAYLEGGR